MNKSKLVAVAFATVIAFAGTTFGQQATQDVTIDVQAINVLAVSSGTVSLTINSATAGSQPDSDTDNSTSYDVTTNEAARKIVGSLDLAYTGSVSLAVSLAAPTGGTSAGSVTLTTTNQDLVSGFGNLAETGHQITYVASSTVTDAPSNQTNTVTFTIVAV